MRRYTLVCDDAHVEQIERIAVEYNLTEQEVLRQLVDAGLDSIEDENGRERGTNRSSSGRGQGREWV